MIDLLSFEVSKNNEFGIKSLAQMASTYRADLREDRGSDCPQYF